MRTKRTKKSMKNEMKNESYKIIENRETQKPQENRETQKLQGRKNKKQAIWSKGVSYKMITSDGKDFLKEEDKILSSVVHVKYNVKLDRIYISCLLKLGNVPVRIGGLQKGNIDNKLKNTVSELVRKNPKLSSREIHEETGYSSYRLNRVYMVAKRELYHG